jgi:hypothetical protein
MLERFVLMLEASVVLDDLLELSRRARCHDSFELTSSPSIILTRPSRSSSWSL